MDTFKTTPYLIFAWLFATPTPTVVSTVDPAGLAWALVSLACHLAGAINL